MNYSHENTITRRNADTVAMIEDLAVVGKFEVTLSAQGFTATFTDEQGCITEGTRELLGDVVRAVWNSRKSQFCFADYRTSGDYRG